MTADPLATSREALRAAGTWLELGAAAALTDEERARMLTTMRGSADLHLALALDAGSDRTVGCEAVEVAAWRRRLPDLVARPWRLTPRPDPLERELNAVWSEIATRHQERFSTPGGTTRATIAGPIFIGHVTRLRELRARRAELEEQLRRAAAPDERARPLASGAVDAARRALAADERYVEIVRLPGRYAALVVAPDGCHLVGLGPAGPVEEAALRARVALEGPGRAAAFREIVPSDPATDADAGGVLARLVVEPLVPYLDGCRQLRMALDGPLLHVPLGVLPPLLEAFAVEYLAGIDDLAPRGPAGAATGPDVVLAAPDYDLGATAPGPSLFRPLDGTAAEADSIARLRPGAVTLVGDRAVKAALREARAPRVLHLATHGYAFSGVADEVLDGLERRLRGDRSMPVTRLHNLRREPDLRSGLALAGANTWLADGDPGPDAGTGLLTVADVVGLDLAGTELVVLSACDTGVGEIDAPDGHASLRAAFLRAGAAAVVASLWKVPDAATRDLMTRFYELLGQGHGAGRGAGRGAGLGPGEALRVAQVERHRAGDPVLNWGGFVCYRRG